MPTVHHELINKQNCCVPHQSSTGFSYAGLDTSLTATARSAADRIRSRMQNNLLETGRDLIAIKDRMQHGVFCAWVRAELNLTQRNATQRNAENYMTAV